MKYTYAKNKYGKYAIPVGMEDTIICNSLIDGSTIWEGGTLDYIENLTLQGDIIHAGAFIGDFVPCLSSLVPNYKVICFEPSELNYKACLETIKINNLDNVELHQRVLGEVNSTDKFLDIFKDGNPAGPMSGVSYNEEYGVDIECITLDSILDQDRPVALIHLDVEGYEMKALQGAVNIIKTYTPVLLIEKYREHLQHSFYNFLLKDLGYVDSGEIGGNTILISKK